MHKIQSIQALRFFAAAMVMFLHGRIFAERHTLDAGRIVEGPLREIGAAGVDIFFVISGAIIYLTAFADRKMTASDFLRKRFIRVAPIYWIVTVASVVILQSPPSFAQWLATFLFWPALSDLVLPPLAIGWTLCFEMLFYVAAAAVLFRRWLLVPILGVLLISSILRPLAPVPAFFGHPLIMEFGFGILIAIAVSRTRAPVWLGLALIGLSLTAFLALETPDWFGKAETAMSPSPSSAVRVVVWGLPAAALVAGTFMLEPWFKGGWAKLLSYLGDASYSIYLAHFALFYLTDEIVPSVNWPGWIVLTLTLTAGCLAGILLHEAVERPLLRFLRGQSSIRFTRLSPS